MVPLPLSTSERPLRRKLTPRDRLLIIKAATEALWQGIAGDAAQWLAENFPGSITERVAGKTEGLLPESQAPTRR